MSTEVPWPGPDAPWRAGAADSGWHKTPGHNQLNVLEIVPPAARCYGVYSPMSHATPTPEAPRARYAFIGGAAAIVEAHIEAMRALPIAIVGMADIDAERGPVQAKKIGCPFFSDHVELLGEAR